MDGYATQIEALHEHAGYVRGEIRPAVDAALDGSRSVSLGPDVLGHICQVYAVFFDQALVDAQDALGRLPELPEGVATGLDESAKTYTAVEDRNRAAFGG